jgi:hypothetical protein
MDPLSRLLSRFTVTAGVLYAGRICGTLVALANEAGMSCARFSARLEGREKGEATDHVVL